MLAHTIKLVAKIDSLKHLLSKAALTGRLAKWVMILSEFDIHYTERRPIKGQVIADQLAEAPLLDKQPMEVEFPDRDVLTVTTNQWTYSLMVPTLEGYTIPRSYRLMFPCINNIPKYEALVTGIKIVVEWRIMELKVYGDFQLVINQINNDYQTKDDNLLPYKRMVDDFK